MSGKMISENDAKETVENVIAIFEDKGIMFDDATDLGISTDEKEFIFKEVGRKGRRRDQQEILVD